MTVIVGIGAALVFATAIALAIFVFAAMYSVIVELPSVRRQRTLHRLQLERRKRTLERERRLRTSFISTRELVQLGEVVDGVLETKPCDPWELEALLDHYVDLALTRERLASAVRNADRPLLEAKLGKATSNAEHDSDCVEVLSRRITHADALSRRLQQTEARLETIGELIRYCGERASVPDLDLAADANLVTTSLERLDALESLERDLKEGEDHGIQH